MHELVVFSCELDDNDELECQDCIHWISKLNVSVIQVAFYLFEVFDDKVEIDEVFVWAMSMLMFKLEIDDVDELDDNDEWYK